MRLFEFIQKLNENVDRKFQISLWVDYSAHNGTLRPNQFAERVSWLEEQLRGIAEDNGLSETGGGGWIGKMGGGRDVSFAGDPIDLNTALTTSKKLAAELTAFQKSVNDTVAKLGVQQMSMEFEFSTSLVMPDATPDGDELTIAYGMADIDRLINGEVSIEQLIDAASEDAGLNESKKSIKMKVPEPRNFVAKNAQTTGSGKHKADKKGGKPSKGAPQPRGEKHKGKLDEEE